MPDASLSGPRVTGGEPTLPVHLALCMRHKDALYRFAFAMTGDEPVAAGIAVDVLVHTANGRNAYGEPGELLTRLLRETVRAVASSDKKRSHVRKATQPAGVRFEAGTEPADIGPLFQQEITRKMLHAALAALPIARRTVLVACDVLTLPEAHVAALVHCSPSDVRDRLERARADFQAELMRLTKEAE
jgi:DNA-directed RNA polymerase specialized sigma24 family protein